MIKWFRNIFGGILLASLGLWFVLHSNYVQEPLLRKAKAAIGQASGGPVAISSLSFALPATLIANDVMLGDPATPWLCARQVAVDFSLSKLWQGDYLPIGVQFEEVNLMAQPDLPLRIISGHIRLSPAFQLAGTYLEITTDANFLKQHARFLPEDKLPAGNLTFKCLLSGSIDSPCATMHVLSQNSDLGEATISATHDTRDGKAWSDGWSGHAAVASHWQKMPFQLSSDYRWQVGAPLSLKNISLKSSVLSLHGNLACWPSEQWIDGELTVSHAELAVLNSWLPTKIDGAATGLLLFQRQPRPTVTITLEAKTLSVENATMEQAHLAVVASDFFTRPRAELRLTSRKMVYEQTWLKNTIFATSIDINHAIGPFSFDSQGFWYEPFDIQAAGRLNFTNAGLQMTFESCQGKVASAPFLLQKAATLEIDQTGLTLTPLAFTLNKGLVQAALAFKEKQVNGNLQFEDIPLNLLSYGIPLQGLLSAEGQIEGALNSPSCMLAIKAKELIVQEKTFASLAPAKAQLQINMDQSGMLCLGDLDVPGYQPVNFSAVLPISLSLQPLVLTTDHAAPVSGELSGTSELTSLLSFFPDSPALSGVAHVELNLSGTLAAPQFNGRCDISNGSFAILKLGAMLHDLNAKFDIADSQLILTTVSADDDNGGKIQGTGHMQLDISKACPFELNLDLNHVTLFNQDYAQASFDGKLALTGDLAAGKLSGSMQATHALFTIPDQAPALMNQIDVTYINQPSDESAPQAQMLTPSASAWPLTLDIAVNFPNNLHIRGRDLTSQWDGSLSLQGTTKTPLVFGDVKIMHGQYLFSGKPFAIDQGTITLAGELDKKTSLYVIASKDLDQVKVDVILKGPVKAPSISFRSNPPLPQREILSWILFNRGTSEISPFQGSQLSESITNLDSNHQGPDVLTRIRKTLGIDRLDINRSGPPGGDGQMSLQIGKYISDKVLITINKSDVNRLAIEAALTKKIKLQAQVGDDAQGQMLLKWKNDY